MSLSDGGPSELFEAAHAHLAHPSLAMTAVAVALSELVKVGYSIDDRLCQIVERLDIGDE